MEKTTIEVKRTSDFNLIESNKRSGYKTVTVAVDINGKKGEMVFEESWKFNDGDKGAKMTSWHFTTGDATIDATMKVQTDFSAYDIVDITISIEGIITEAENFFSDLKQKEKDKKDEEQKRARAASYDASALINAVKPALEAKGHVVTVSTTKEQYMEGRDIGLMVGAGISVGYNYDGHLRAHNGLYGNDQVEGKTKSAKIEKIVATIVGVIDGNAYRIKEAKEKKEKLAGAKEKLESILGFEMVEMKEYHSGNSYGSRKGNSPGYETSYFVAKDKTKKASGLRFTENSRYVDAGKASIKGFSVTMIPMFTDDAKLRKMVDLLNE